MTGAVEAMKLVARTADAAGEAQDITAGALGAVTSDGGELFFLLDDRGRGRLRRGPLGADGTLGPARAAFPGENEPNIGNFALSRDGRLLAYVTREPDSSSNLFLTRLPAGSGQWLVAENAVRPRFGPDGRELFYLRISTDAPGQTRVALMLARLTIDPAVTIGAIAEVFNSAGPRGPRLDGYDISPDGRRFLMSRPAAAPGEGTRIVLIQNWQAVLRH